jgi:hypothetical protein
VPRITSRCSDCAILCRVPIYYIFTIATSIFCHHLTSRLPPNQKSKPSPHHLASHNIHIPRYKVLPGNNSRVILSTLKVRSWWHGIQGPDDDNTLAANSPMLIWEMYRCDMHTSSL